MDGKRKISLTCHLSMKLAGLFIIFMDYIFNTEQYAKL
jgi:hypothetical protein